MEIKFIHIPKNAGLTFANIIKRGLKKKSPVKYCYHNTDVFKLKPTDKTLVILRDPIDRFCSAVRYAIQKWSNDQNVRRLINLGIIEPNQFAEILSDKNHKHYDDVFREVGNTIQKLGDRKLELKWTYTPQHYWVNNPSYIILFENFESETKLLFKSIGYNIKIPKINKTKKNNLISLSEKSINFLKDLYKKDYEIIEKYKKMDVKKRLNLI